MTSLYFFNEKKLAFLDLFSGLKFKQTLCFLELI